MSTSAPRTSELGNFLNPHIHSAAGFFRINISRRDQMRIDNTLATISPITFPIIDNAKRLTDNITNWIFNKTNCNANEPVGKITKSVLRVLVGIGLAVAAIKAAGYLLSFTATLILHSLATLVALAAIICAVAIGGKYMLDNGYLSFDPQNLRQSIHNLFQPGRRV